MSSGGDGIGHGFMRAVTPQEGDVVRRRLGPHGRSIRRQRVAAARHGRKRSVIHLHELGGIGAHRGARGHDHGDRLAQMPHDIVCKERARGRGRRRAVRTLELYDGLDRRDPIGGQILGGQHGDDARQRRGRVRRDALDARVAVRAAQEDGVAKPVGPQVGGENALAGEKPVVLAARHRRAERHIG